MVLPHLALPAPPPPAPLINDTYISSIPSGIVKFALPSVLTCSQYSASFERRLPVGVAVVVNTTQP